MREVGVHSDSAVNIDLQLQVTGCACFMIDSEG